MKIKTMKKIMAWAGLIIHAAIYLATGILGFFGSPATAGAVQACIVLTIVVPVLMFAMIRIAKILSHKDDEDPS